MRPTTAAVPTAEAGTAQTRTAPASPPREAGAPGPSAFWRPSRVRGASPGELPADLGGGHLGRHVGDLAALLSGVPGDLLRDLHDDPVAQGLGGHLTTAAAPDQRLDHLVDVVLGHARGALVQMLLDEVQVGLAELAVEVLEHLVEDLGAVRRVRVPAAHAAPPSLPAPTRPRSRA